VSGRLAVIGKQRTVGEPRPDTRLVLEGMHEPVAVVDEGTHVVLYRHGLDEYVPPHRIDHAGNARALRDLGCDRIMAVGSVGSLRASLPVGSFLVPDDFIALDQAPVAASADETQHVVPGFAPEWRAAVVGAWQADVADDVVDGGVYWQTNGPQFETPAEIRMIASHADVVGMTVASESVAAAQLGLRYAAVCIIDNLANGIAEHRLTREEYERGQAANQRRLADALAAVVPVLA
jgi:5'-methylthioadenosine phosphorylase